MFFKDQNNDLWAGSQKGINLLHLESPLRFYGENQGIDEYVLSLCKFEGKLYAGCYDATYYLEPTNLLDNPNANFKTSSNPLLSDIKVEEAFSFDSIPYSIRKGVVDDSGVVWLTSESQGIIKLEFRDSLQDYTLTFLKKDHDLLIAKRPYIEIVDGEKYVNTDSGGYKLVEKKLNNGECSFSLENTLLKKYIDKSAVGKILYDSQSNFWLHLNNNYS